MPGWIADLTVAQLVAFGLFIVAVVGGIWKFGRPAVRVGRRVMDLLDLLLGTPAKTDASGAEEEPARPGLIVRLSAMEEHQSSQGQVLETVRAQVQNSHRTNLRDDLDELTRTVETLVNKFAEHIAIAKESDRRQDATAEQVRQLLDRIAKPSE